MQSITQKYLKNEYLPINSSEKYRVCDFMLLNDIIRSVLQQNYIPGQYKTLNLCPSGSAKPKV